MQDNTSQDTRPHYPFEHVESPAHPLSSHRHNVKREDDTDMSDFQPPHISDKLIGLLSKWGWASAESEGHSESRKGLPGHGSPDPTTQSRPQDTDLPSFESDQTQKTTVTNKSADEASRLSFAEKYGKFNKILHYGDSNTVQLYEKKLPALAQSIPPAKNAPGSMMARLRRASTFNTIRELYAVKVFHHAQKTRLSLPSSLQTGTQTVALDHPNIVPILDILYNEQDNLCLVMPYLSGASLHSFLAHKKRRKESLLPEEANCLAIQLLRAVAFLHENDIAHGDLRPEHVLLTSQGAVKLGGFGEDQDAIQGLMQRSHGDSPTSTSVSSPNSASASRHKPNLCLRRKLLDSSAPYLPPERLPGRHGSRRQSYTKQDVSDMKTGDIWACGIIYMVLRSGRLLWQSAQRANESFAYYLHSRLDEDGYSPIQVLENVSHSYHLSLVNRKCI
ncbi:kinase-like domain-containing protein [Penicillium soppii]|uniref:kinase-like domain-containing protein n=1 Tax=Penicillium soppii TaxID=69789 RepID=UPI002546EDEC|nr:kinase-like domain-containing protein [Penicillium soppii]KAJ5872759.1 kinase-like domain-containing protein [Penicillium soppii]